MINEKNIKENNGDLLVCISVENYILLLCQSMEQILALFCCPVESEPLIEKQKKTIIKKTEKDCI